MSKRPCHPPPTVSSCETFDVNVHSLYSIPCHATFARPLPPICIEVKPNILSQTKEYPISIVILADISGSMLDGSKMENMRKGIVRLGDLAARFSTIRTELTIIGFNDEAQVTHSSKSMPSVEELDVICRRLSPSGGTNIGAALEAAMEVVTGAVATHIVLFTDGEDTCDLRRRLITDSLFLKDLRTLPKLWLHCVGIGANFDSSLLDAIARAARRGTFQGVEDADIPRLMGSLWGFLMEAVDVNCVLEVTADEAEVDRRELVMRICDPPSSPYRLVVEPRSTNVLEAVMYVDNESSKTAIARCEMKGSYETKLIVGKMPSSSNIAELLSSDDPKSISELTSLGPPANDVSMLHLLTDLRTSIFESVLSALTRRNYTEALLANKEGVDAIRLHTWSLSSKLVQEFTDACIHELEAQAIDIMRGRNDTLVTREIEVRAMARYYTFCNNGATIDPDSESLSELQKQLSSSV